MSKKNLPTQKNGFNSTALAKPRKPKTFKMAKYGTVDNVAGSPIVLLCGSVVGLSIAFGFWPVTLTSFMAGSVTGAGIRNLHKKNMGPTTWTTEAGQTLSAPGWAKNVYNEIQTSLYGLYKKDKTQPKVQKKLAKIHQTAQDLETYLTVLGNNNQPDHETSVQYLKEKPIVLTRVQTVVAANSVINAQGTETQQKPKRIPPLSV